MINHSMTPIRIQFVNDNKLVAEVIVHNFDVSPLYSRLAVRKLKTNKPMFAALTGLASTPRYFDVPVGSPITEESKSGDEIIRDFIAHKY